MAWEKREKCESEVKKEEVKIRKTQVHGYNKSKMGNN
jgi:hypothetical protein